MADFASAHMIVLLHGIGDQILATPAIRSYKREHPETELILGVRDDNSTAELWRHNPHVDRVAPLDIYPDYWLPSYWLHQREFESRIRRAATEAGAVDYTHVRYGRLPTPAQRLLRYPPKMLRFAEEIGVSPDSYRTELFIGNDERDAVDRFIDELHWPAPMRLVAVNRSAALPWKYWDINAFEQTCDALVARGFGVIQCYYPGSRRGELARDKRAARLPHGNATTSERLYDLNPSILTMAALFARCEAVISVDTGLMHLAYAMQTPTVGVFVSASPRIAAPVEAASLYSVAGQASAATVLAALRI